MVMYLMYLHVCSSVFSYVCSCISMYLHVFLMCAYANPKGVLWGVKPPGSKSIGFSARNLWWYFCGISVQQLGNVSDKNPKENIQYLDVPWNPFL
jgi:hypothetical protein